MIYFIHEVKLTPCSYLVNAHNYIIDIPIKTLKITVRRIISRINSDIIKPFII